VERRFWAFLLVIATACLGPRPAEPPKPPPPRWGLVVDREGIVIDGVRTGEKDQKRIQEALVKHWKDEPFLDVTADATALSVFKVLEASHGAKLITLTVKSGAYSRDFWTSYLLSEPKTAVLQIHAVGGDLVRFRRFVISPDPTAPMPYERIDWHLGDAQSLEALRNWLGTNGQALEQGSLVTLETMPFSELAKVLTLLNELWPEGKSVRLVLQQPIRLGFDAPLEDRLSADTLPPAVIHPSMSAIAEKLYACYHERAAPGSGMGEIYMTLSITAAGVTSGELDTGTTVKDEKIIDCMKERIATLRFPSREGAAIVKAQHGFHYYPKKQPD
jgi:hypothetical protein